VLEVYYNGALVLEVNTTDACDLAPTTLSCPFPAKSISYTDSYQVPFLPSGSYTFRIRNLFGMAYFQQQTGCLEIDVQIVNTQTQSCTYDSTATALVTVTPTFPDSTSWSQRTIGDSLVIGQAWGNTDAPWGTFTSVTASPDLFLFGSAYGSPADLFWALSGNLYSITNTSAGSVNYRYSGIFFVGYNGTSAIYRKLLTYEDPVLSGTFDWTFSISKTGVETLTGTFQIDPSLGYQPTGWPYPLGFGRLDNYTLTQSSNLYAIKSSKSYDSCVSASGSPSNIVSQANSNTSSKYTNDQKWAIGLGVAGFLLVIGIIVLLFIAWRQNKNRLYLNDDDLVDPLKPDYGSLAINDIIEDAEDLPR